MLREASGWKHVERGPTGSWWKGGAQIGRGSYGRVFKAMRLSNGEVFVVKEAVARRGDNPGEDTALLTELEVLQSMRHPHIVAYLGHEYVDDRLCICLEYMPGDSLRGMVNEFGAMEGELLQKAARGVLEGLNYLHTHRPLVVHRDLKGANILVDQHFWPKLADFGCSKRSFHGSQSFSTVGSIPWMAPEVMNAESSKLRGAGRKADIWSLGCLVVELATATNPWGEGAFENQLHAFKVIGRSDRTPPVPQSLARAGLAFVGLCLRRDAARRPWAAELLDHPFVKHWKGQCVLSGPA